MASIRCAHCAFTHTDVASVRACAFTPNQADFAVARAMINQGHSEEQIFRAIDGMLSNPSTTIQLLGMRRRKAYAALREQASQEIVPTTEDFAIVRAAIAASQYPLSELRQSLVHSISTEVETVADTARGWLAAFDQIMAETTVAPPASPLVVIPVFVHAQGVDGKTLCDQHIASLNPAHVVADYLDLPGNACPNCVAYMKEIESQAVQPITQPGMYRKPNNGHIYRVKFNKAGTHLYAERVTRETHYNTPKIVFTYMPGELKNLTADMRMTLDEAKAASADFVACCVCGRVLKNKISQEAGIGPICASRV